jgi:hypothetical protein
VKDGGSDWLGNTSLRILMYPNAILSTLPHFAVTSLLLAIISAAVEVINSFDTQADCAAYCTSRYSNDSIMSTIHDNDASSDRNKRSGSTANSARVQDPCPFLDIPIELRLMIYELVPIRIREFCQDHNVDDESYPIKFLVPCTTVALLVTCRQVQQEAADIMEKKLAKLRNTPLRVTVNIMLLYYLHTSNGPFYAINTYVKLVTHADEMYDDDPDHENALRQV